MNAAGLIPVSLIRWEMTGKDDEIKRMLNEPDFPAHLLVQRRERRRAEPAGAPRGAADWFRYREAIVIDGSAVPAAASTTIRTPDCRNRR